MSFYTGFQQELPGEPGRFISVECSVKDYLGVKQVVEEKLKEAGDEK